MAFSIAPRAPQYRSPLDYREILRSTGAEITERDAVIRREPMDDLVVPVREDLVELADHDSPRRPFPASALRRRS